MSKVRVVAIVVAVVGILAACAMLFSTFMEYKKAEDEYSGLEQYVSTSTAKTQEPEKAPNALPNNGLMNIIANQDVEVLDEEEKELARNYNRSDFPDIEVDFDGLRAINPNFVCWLYAEGAKINYPVVQGKDNDYYLHHTFEDKENSAGCVFMDWEVDPKLTSWNTFIYGHNMKNGTMFGHLKNYINNNSTYEKDLYIYIFRPEGIYRYEIFSYYLDSTDSKMYYTCDNFKEYRMYLREATTRSVRECKAKARPDDNIITLVTCSGAGANKKRFFVHGVFVDRYLFE